MAVGGVRGCDVMKLAAPVSGCRGVRGCDVMKLAVGQWLSAVSADVMCLSASGAEFQLTSLLGAGRRRRVFTGAMP